MTRLMCPHGRARMQTERPRLTATYPGRGVTNRHAAGAIYSIVGPTVQKIIGLVEYAAAVLTNATAVREHDELFECPNGVLPFFLRHELQHVHAPTHTNTHRPIPTKSKRVCLAVSRKGSYHSRHSFFLRTGSHIPLSMQVTRSGTHRQTKKSIARRPRSRAQQVKKKAQELLLLRRMTIFGYTA